MSEYPDDLVKSTFAPNRPSTEFDAPEEKLPFEDEAISLLVKLGVTNWGRVSLAIASVYLRNAFNKGERAQNDKQVRLVELTASYCHGSPEYWNDKDAAVLIEMASRMAPCTESAGASLYKLRTPSEPHQEHRKANDA